MAKNLHKRLRELQRVAALHQNQTVAPIGMPVISDAQVTSAPATAAVTAIGTPEHYKIIRKDLVFVVILMIIMVALLLGLTWLIGHTGLSNWIVGLGKTIR